MCGEAVATESDDARFVHAYPKSHPLRWHSKSWVKSNTRPAASFQWVGSLVRCVDCMQTGEYKRAGAHFGP